MNLSRVGSGALLRSAAAMLRGFDHAAARRTERDPCTLSALLTGTSSAVAVVEGAGHALR